TFVTLLPGFQGNYMDSRYNPKGRTTACLNNGTRWVWWGLFLPLIFLSQFGRGTQLLPGYAEMCVFGNLPKKHLLQLLNVRNYLVKYLKRISYLKVYQIS